MGAPGNRVGLRGATGFDGDGGGFVTMGCSTTTGLGGVLGTYASQLSQNHPSSSSWNPVVLEHALQCVGGAEDDILRGGEKARVARLNMVY